MLEADDWALYADAKVRAAKNVRLYQRLKAILIRTYFKPSFLSSLWHFDFNRVSAALLWKKKPLY
jgi:hypothetical protein